MRHISFLGLALMPVVCAQYTVPQLAGLLFADISYETREEPVTTIWETDTFTAPCSCTESPSTSTHFYTSNWSTATTSTIISELSTETTSASYWHTASIRNIPQTSLASSSSRFVISPYEKTSRSIRPSLSTSRYPAVHPSPIRATVHEDPTPSSAASPKTQKTTVASLVPTSATETILATFQTSLLTTTVRINTTLSGEATTVTARTTNTATVVEYSTFSVEGTTTITLPYSTLSHTESTTIVVASESPEPAISPSSVSIVPSSRSMQTERTTPGSISTTLAAPTFSAGRSTVTAKTTLSVVTPTPSPSFVPSSNTLSICPSRIINPTYTAPTPLPTDYTWGCPPGYLCHPKKSAADGNCNFEAGPPADTYYCSPEECIPVPPLHEPQYPVSNKTEKYIVSPGYFNLNPTKFGLDYGIFAFPNGSSLENGQEERRRGQNKRQYSTSIIPGLCFDQCNNCMVEAQQTGKTPLLCQNGSEFKIQLDMCDSCVESHWDAIITIGGILPQFQQFLDFCGDISSQPTLQPGISPPAATESGAPTSSSEGTILSTETGKTESTLTPRLTTSPTPATTETSIEPTTTRGTYSTTSTRASTVPIESSIRTTTTLSAEPPTSVSSSTISVLSTESTSTSHSAETEGISTLTPIITSTSSSSPPSSSSSDSSSSILFSQSDTISSQSTTQTSEITSTSQTSISTSRSQTGPEVVTGSRATEAWSTTYPTTEKGVISTSTSTEYPATPGTGRGTGETPEPQTGTTSMTGPSSQPSLNGGLTGSSGASSAIPSNGEISVQQPTTSTTIETGLTGSNSQQAASPTSTISSITPNGESPEMNPTTTITETFIPSGPTNRTTPMQTSTNFNFTPSNFPAIPNTHITRTAITTAAAGPGSRIGTGTGTGYPFINSNSSSIAIPPNPTPTPSLFEGRASLAVQSGRATWLLVVFCVFFSIGDLVL